MELKVSVEGVERSVSGLATTTTCAQVIYALAHATKQKGRFILVERFREAERVLGPNEHPIELLARWGDRAKEVGFLLRRVDEAPNSISPSSSSSLLTPLVPPPEIPKSATGSASSSSANYQRFDDLASVMHQQSLPKNPSNSSVRSAAPTVHYQKPSLDLAGRSTSSLPGYSGGTLNRQRRPPPPAYEKVIEQKYNSLSRGATMGKQRAPLDLHSLTAQLPVANMNLPRPELEALIERQRQTIDQQKARLILVEASLSSNEQREVLQLERQQENLRVVLEKVRQADWPRVYQAELEESKRLEAAISTIHNEIEEIKKQIAHHQSDEMDLRRKIAEVQAELTAAEQKQRFSTPASTNELPRVAV